MNRTLALVVASMVAQSFQPAASGFDLATANNQLGLDLYRTLA